MSISQSQKLSKLQKCAVGSAVLLFIFGLIAFAIFLITSFDLRNFGELLGMGLIYGGLFGSILIGSYVKYKFGIAKGK